MATEAQRRATARYDRDNTRQFKLKLNRRTDRAVIEWLEGQANVQGYVKRLVIEDMYRDAEDRVNAEAIERDMADGVAAVGYSDAEGVGAATFEGVSGTVARWLVREFDARQEGDDRWVVYCGDGQGYDRRIMPILERLLGMG